MYGLVQDFSNNAPPSSHGAAATTALLLLSTLLMRTRGPGLKTWPVRYHNLIGCLEKVPCLRFSQLIDS
jgi:hypothetical protein